MEDICALLMNYLILYYLGISGIYAALEFSLFGVYGIFSGPDLCRCRLVQMLCSLES